MRLQKEFFNRNAPLVARELLGKYLVRKNGHKRLVARITETEAYHGPQDRASHARFGPTPRAKLMFGPPGYIYVYMIYGVYHCLNFVTGPDGFPSAVLIRAAEIPGGNGPGRLCRLLNIDKRLNGLKPGNGKLWVENRGEKPLPRIKCGKRIGVDYAGPWKHKLWRFWVDN